MFLYWLLVIKNNSKLVGVIWKRDSTDSVWVRISNPHTLKLNIYYQTLSLQVFCEGSSEWSSAFLGSTVFWFWVEKSASLTITFKSSLHSKSICDKLIFPFSLKKFYRFKKRLEKVQKFVIVTKWLFRKLSTYTIKIEI